MDACPRNRGVDDVYPELVTCVYSGTAMLNRILMRKGSTSALILHQCLRSIRWAGAAERVRLRALEDRIHSTPTATTNRWCACTRGVTERTGRSG